MPRLSKNRPRVWSIFLFAAVMAAFALPVFAQQVDTAWVRRYNGPGNGNDSAVAIAVDSSGNVYVTGSSFDSTTGYDYCTIKYLPNGDTAWVRRYNGPANLNDIAAALVLDDSGNVYVTGTSGNSSYSYTSDITTIKYNQSGDSLWVRRFSNCGNNVASCDSAVAIAVDSFGCIYVTGFDRECGLDLPLCRYVTIKYSSEGTRQWVSCFGTLWFQLARAMFVDRNRNVYVTGSSNFNSNGGQFDFLTTKYGPDGNVLWKAYYNGPANNDDIARAVAVDTTGNIYVTGVSNGDILTIKYDSAGTQLWVQRLASVFGAGNEAGGFAVGLDRNQHVFVTGQAWDVEGMGWFTIKYDSLGNRLWIKEILSSSPSFALAVDGLGNVYVTSGNYGYNTIKYDSLGSQVWSKTYFGPAYLSQPKALALDVVGNVYVTGFSAGSGTGYDFATIKYSPLPQLKGDLNLDGVLSAADVVDAVNCTFLGQAPPAAPMAADLNCDGKVTPADVVILLNMVFLSAPAPC